MDPNLQISPRYKVRHWLDIRTPLNTPAPEQWEKAVDILRDRIWGRFIEPVDTIQRLPFAGFAVMALDCLLIDTIQSFKEGRVRAHGTEASAANSFKDFLTTSQHFRHHFLSRNRAGDFYDSVRCGLLHNGEARNNWKIWIEADGDHTRIIEKNGNYWIVYRKTFHEALKQDFLELLSVLKDSRNLEERTNFLKRMDSICDNHILYFAYGSNMDPDRLICRGVHGARSLGRVVLRDFVLRFNKHSSG